MKLSEKPPTGRPAGWSLTEIVVAVCILAFCLIAILRVMGTAGSGTSRAGVHSRGTRLLQGLIEEVRTIPLNRLETLFPGDESEVVLDGAFYPASLKTLQEAKTSRDPGPKDFAAEVRMMCRKNSTGTIREFWYHCQIKWKAPESTKEKTVDQFVRGGGVITKPAGGEEQL